MLQLRLCSFNFGIDQKMLRRGDATETTIQRHCANFARVCAELASQGDLDILCGCEVGGKGEGFKQESIEVSDVLRPPFGEDIRIAEIGNYIAVFRFPTGGASQPTEVFLRRVERYTPPSCRSVEAAITIFEVRSRTHDISIHLVVGNLHIDGGSNSPPDAQKLRIVNKLRNELETYTTSDSNMPIVRLIVGATI